jgi:hypothetical protein
MVMSQNMRLNSLNKLLPNPLKNCRLTLTSVSSRFALVVLIASATSITKWSAHAANTLEMPTAKTALSKLPFEKTSVKSEIEVVNRPLIAGLWGMIIPNVKCVEYYNFKENGEFLVKSAGEWSTGKYVYQLPNMEDMATSLPQLTMGIQYDSNDADCSGNKINQTGEVQQEYVKWISPSRIKFCATTDGQQCPLELNKVLP